MLAVWRDWRLPDHLMDACEEGGILAGIIAGAICWSKQHVKDAFAGGYMA